MLLKYTILLIGLTTVYSCGNQSKRIYIISREDSIAKVRHTTKGGIVLMPPRIPVGTYNFIIDDDNHCFFYGFQSPQKLGGVGDDRNSIFEPVFLNLMPNNIFGIPKDCERMFVDENVLKVKYTVPKSIVVSSFKDTIDNAIIPYLEKLESEAPNKISLLIRRATKEERVVLFYKLQNKYYTPRPTK